MPRTRATGPYVAFLKACKGWRDPNPLLSPAHPEVGRALCLGCVSLRGRSYLKPLGPHRYEGPCGYRKGEL